MSKRLEHRETTLQPGYILRQNTVRVQPLTKGFNPHPTHPISKDSLQVWIWSFCLHPYSKFKFIKIRSYSLLWNLYLLFAVKLLLSHPFFVRNYTTQFARSWGGENLGIITTDGERFSFLIYNKYWNTKLQPPILTKSTNANKYFLFFILIDGELREPFVWNNSRTLVWVSSILDKVSSLKLRRSSRYYKE